MFPNIFGKIWKIGWAAFADVSEVARLAGLLDWLDWLALLGPFLLFSDWAGLGWLGPLVVIVVFLIFLLLAVLSVSWARQYLHCHHVDGCGASLIFFWCLPSVFYFFLWTLLYESPGGNQVDGLPPVRHSGGNQVDG